MLIAEIFEALQGEGPSKGLPSIFIRFWGCNLRCQFNSHECDTPYAVYTEKEEAEELSVDEVVDRIRSFKSENIIFTGGEPMLFQEEMIMISNEFPHYRKEVETNGTIPPLTALTECIDSFNISPKLKSSNQETELHENRRIDVDVLKAFPWGKSFLKFVINDTAEDVPEIQSLIEHLEHPVWLMPEGGTKDELIAHSPEVEKLCAEYNWNFTTREHILMFDGERGK